MSPKMFLIISLTEFSKTPPATGSLSVPTGGK